MKIEYQKRRYQENPEVRKEHLKKKYKKYQENKKTETRLCISCKK